MTEIAQRGGVGVAGPARQRGRDGVKQDGPHSERPGRVTSRTLSCRIPAGGLVQRKRIAGSIIEPQHRRTEGPCRTPTPADGHARALGASSAPRPTALRTECDPGEPACGSRKADLRRIRAKPGVRRRFEPRQLRHAHTPRLPTKAYRLLAIPRQLGHSNSPGWAVRRAKERSRVELRALHTPRRLSAGA